MNCQRQQKTPVGFVFRKSEEDVHSSRMVGLPISPHYAKLLYQSVHQNDRMEHKDSYEDQQRLLSLHEQTNDCEAH